MLKWPPMQKEVKQVEPNLYDVAIEIPQDEVGNATKEIAQIFGADMAIKGFRKGKAPIDLVIRSVGDEKIKEELIRRLVGPSLLTVLKEENLIPIINPSVDKLVVELDSPMKFTARITTYPEVKVTGYKTIKSKKPEEKQISETDVDNVVDNLFKQVENPPARENILVDSKGDKLTLGSKNEAKPDDSFAVKMGAKDLDDLKLKIKENLVSESKLNFERDYETAILEDLVNKTKVNLPEGLIEVEIDNILRKVVYDLESMGMSFEDYLKSQNKKIEEVRKEYRESAIKTVTAQLALNEVSKEEKLEVTDSEIEKALPVAEKGHVHSSQEKNQMHAWLVQRKALEFLKGQIK